MRVNRDQLIKTLDMVKSGISPREFIEQSSCVVFQNGKVMTFNDEVACKMKIEFKFTGAVQAAALMSILEKMEEPELKVRENEEGQLEFRGKNKAFAIVRDAEIFLPIDKVEVPTKWRDLEPEFTEAVGLVKHCASMDENRFVLTCIHIHPDYVEACDNLQCMRVNVKTGVKESVLVRATAISDITQLAMDRIALTPAWIHFRNQSGLEYSCRRYSDDYPSLDSFLNVKGHPITIPKGLSQASERAAIFAADKAGDALMEVKVKQGLIRLKGSGLTGWYKEIKKTNYKGPDMEFLISPDLLKHISEKYSDARLGNAPRVGQTLKVTGGSWEYCTVLGIKGEQQEEEAEEEA